VYCQREYLADCPPVRIQHALDEFPATLDETYERTLREIKETDSEYARRLLQCVTVASLVLAVECPKDPNSQRVDDASTPLHLASTKGYVDVARMSVEHGADVSAQDKDGRTPLQLASSKGHVSVARMLVECGSDVSAQNKDG
jgi:ankyrin repeat protein